jgi:hypothetical protein
MTFTLDLPPELIETIAQRAAQIVMEQTPPAEDGWLRGAEQIAGYLDSSASRIYTLSASRRIPVQRDGAAIVAKRSVLDDWIREGGDRCPAGTRPRGGTK